METDVKYVPIEKQEYEATIRERGMLSEQWIPRQVEVHGLAFIFMPYWYVEKPERRNDRPVLK